MMSALQYANASQTVKDALGHRRQFVVGKAPVLCDVEVGNASRRYATWHQRSLQ